jgi:hypothetical protein
MSHDRHTTGQLKRRANFANISAAVLFVLMGLYAVVIVANHLTKPQPSKPAIVVITDIYPVQSRYSSKMGVSYRTSDGLTGSSIYAATSLNCQVGDTVHAFRSGMTLTLAVGQC